MGAICSKQNYVVSHDRLPPQVKAPAATLPRVLRIEEEKFLDESDEKEKFLDEENQEKLPDDTSGFLALRAKDSLKMSYYQKGAQTIVRCPHRSNEVPPTQSAAVDSGEVGKNVGKGK